MTEHEHDYRKLSDEAVFCRGCGDIKHAEPPVCALPHYPIVYPYVPPVVYPPVYVPPWRPNVYPWWTVTNGTVETGFTTHEYPAGTSVSYTADPVRSLTSGALS